MSVNGLGGRLCRGPLELIINVVGDDQSIVIARDMHELLTSLASHGFGGWIRESGDGIDQMAIDFHPGSWGFNGLWQKFQHILAIIPH